jgi:hypothetical protein
VTVIASPQIAGWVEIALLVASVIGFVALLSSPDIVPNPAQRKRLVTVVLMAVGVALVIARPLDAFFYDLDPYCRYAWWWDFITCGW